MIDEIKNNKTINEISIEHKRSEGGIKAKIQKLSNTNDICKKYCIDNNIINIYEKTKKEMIYILQLEHNKYYVGWTQRSDGERFDEHFDGNGSAWTKKYKPIQVLKWINGTKQDEDNITLELMKEVGWYNVRGGKWCKVCMTEPPEELNTCSKKVTNAINKITNNKNSKNINDKNNTEKWNCKFCNKEFDSKKGTIYHENMYCKIKKSK